MSVKVLQDILSDDFNMAAAFMGTPTGLYWFLHGRQEVFAIRETLRQGALTENTIRRFVAALMEDLRRGTRFPHELAISALAVALETRSTDFAEEFLFDLAKLKTVEMSLSVRVARECLKRRFEMSRTKTKQLCLGATFTGGNVRLWGGRSAGSSMLPPMQSNSKCVCGAT